MRSILDILGSESTPTRNYSHGQFLSNMKTILTKFYGAKMYRKNEIIESNYLKKNSVHIILTKLWANFIFSNTNFIKFKDILLRIMSRHGMLCNIGVSLFWKIKTTNQLIELMTTDINSLIYK